MRYGLRHPLDVDLADLADDLVGPAQRADLERHLSECLLCRIKLRRLRDAHGQEPVTREAVVAGLGSAATQSFAVPGITNPDAAVDRPAAGQIWAAGDDERILLLVIRQVDDRVFAAPVTFDVLSADDETVVVNAEISPFGISLAIYPTIAAEVPISLLVAHYGELVAAADVGQLLDASHPGTVRGEPITGPTDPRLEFRQMLMDHFGALEEIEPDPDTGADAPPPRPEQVASTLVAALRRRRGEACKVHRLASWDDLVLGYSKSWSPVVAVDEFGTILIVFDTPSGLSNDADFNTAMAVLTRFNASAVVVLTTALSDAADIFDAASLNFVIGVPSGQTNPPAPVLSGLAPVDAISKFLDQNSTWSEATWLTRGTAVPSDVIATLSRSAVSAVEGVVSEGRRARIAPKIAGYASIEHLAHDLDLVLRGAFSGAAVAEGLSDLADRSEP